jgi:hypothetical protein
MADIKKFNEIFSGTYPKGDPLNTNIPRDNAEPLFTTEDGVDIFKGDTFYTAWINPHPSVTPEIANIHTTSYDIGNIKRFASEEAADAYIDSIHEDDYIEDDYIEEGMHIRRFNEDIGEVLANDYFEEDLSDEATSKATFSHSRTNWDDDKSLRGDKIEDSEGSITLTKEELLTFKEDIEYGIWSDTSYKICEFLGIDPTEGT